MHIILLYLITIIHILFILFLILAPFSQNNLILFLHFITIPFLLLHWILNDDTCAISLIETHIRKQIYNNTNDINDCFSCKLFSPIYKITNNYKSFSTIVYTVCIILWLITTNKLYNKYKNSELQFK